MIDWLGLPVRVKVRVKVRVTVKVRVMVSVTRYNIIFEL